MNEEQQDQYFNDIEKQRCTIMDNLEYFAGRVNLEVPDVITGEWLDLVAELNIAMNREEK